MAELTPLVKEAYELVYADIPANSRWTPVETAGKIVEAVIASKAFIEYFKQKHGLMDKSYLEEYAEQSIIKDKEFRKFCHVFNEEEALEYAKPKVVDTTPIVEVKPDETL